MKKQARLLALGLALLLGLSGCMGGEMSDMFSLPQPPDDYKNLNAAIEQVIQTTGGESIAPQTGANTQTVQLQDLDGDGVQESALAFFRVSDAEKPLKIYVFKVREDESYRVDTIIDGVGSAINSVAYENVGGSPEKEVVVSWQISSNDYTLGIYSMDDMEGIELLWVSSYTRFRLTDLDQDGQKEAVVLNMTSGEEQAAWADYYDYDGAAMALKATAPLSTGVNEIRTLRGGSLIDGVPAVFVTSSFSDSTDQVVDILACPDNTFTNITLNSETRRSEETVRVYTAVSGADINADGVMEVPRPIAAPKSAGATDDFWYLDWRQFDLDGKPHSMFVTFHTVTDGWYFIVPDSWTRQVTISRKDSVSADERAVVFSKWNGDTEAATPFMIFYKLTGTNQSNRAAMGRRKTLFSDASATYAYELLPDSWDAGLSQEEILQRFHIIRSEWAADN